MLEIRRHNFGWDVASAILHALLFLLLVCFTPVRKLILPDREPSPPAAERLSADAIERLDEKLADARLRELQRLLDDLQTVLNDMEVVRDQLRQDFDDVVLDLASGAKDELRKAAEEVRGLQREALAKQDATAKSVEKLGEALKRDLEESHPEVRELNERLTFHEFGDVAASQSAAQNALDSLRTSAAFSGFEKVAETAAALRDAQIAAARVQTAEAEEILAPAHRTAGFEWDLRNLKGVEDNAARERANAARDREEAQKASAEAKAAAERRDAAETQRDRDKAENDRRNAEKRAADSLRRAEDAERRAAEKDRRAAEAREAVERKKQAARDADPAAMRERQAQAREAQKKVLDAMEKLDAAIDSDVAETKPHATDEDVPSELAVRDLSELTISEAYEMARTLEEAVTETYREVAAASAALEQRLPLKEAEQLTDVAKPVREDIDADLLDGRARTAEELAAQKEARYDAVREAENMVDASVAMLDEALRIAGAGGTDRLREAGARGHGLRWLRRGDLAGRDRKARSERFIALSGLAGQLERAAAENGAARAKDMTALTRGARGRAEPVPSDGRNTPAERGAGEPAARADGAGTGEDLLPGNVLSFDEASGGRPGAWMYLNSWWIIGPFPNPERVNLVRKFPPESVVDLDAAYQGADGPVRWQFVQARSGTGRDELARRAEVSPPGSPEYTIWYGWTRLLVDRACDVWLAAGSDDRSDVWVNGMKVWASGNELKQWRIGEGFRKIHLEEGANEILVRVENGHWNCGFSLCVSPYDVPPPL